MCERNEFVRVIRFLFLILLLYLGSDRLKSNKNDFRLMNNNHDFILSPVKNFPPKNVLVRNYTIRILLRIFSFKSKNHVRNADQEYSGLLR